MADDVVANAKSKADKVSSSGAQGTQIWVSGSKGGSRNAGRAGAPMNDMQTRTPDQMKVDVYSWASSRSPKYDQYVQKLVASGFISKSSAKYVYNTVGALDNAISMYQGFAAGGGNLSFDDWFDWYASTGSGDQSGGGAYTGPVTTTSTTVYSDKAAETVLQKMAREKFGYNLSKKEVAEYTKQLQEEQKKNPSITRSAGTGATRTSDTTQAVSGEVLAGEMLGAEQQAEDFAVESIGMEQMWNSINRGMKVIQGA